MIDTFVDKLPRSTTSDSRIHALFRSTGAATGRFSSAEPNLMNIPSRSVDIRHMFRATPGYVILSSDYSAQEPRITSYVADEKKMQDAFKHDKDVYATIASVAFKVPYEQCLEFHPQTHEYQPDGKARRNEAKLYYLELHMVDLYLQLLISCMVSEMICLKRIKLRQPRKFTMLL